MSAYGISPFGFGRWLRSLVAVAAVALLIRVGSQWLTFGATADLVTWLRAEWAGELTVALIWTALVFLREDIRQKLSSKELADARYLYVFLVELVEKLSLFVVLAFIIAWLRADSLVALVPNLVADWQLLACFFVTAVGVAVHDAHRRWIGPGYGARDVSEGQIQ